MSPPRIPRATYRLQLNSQFTFAAAEALVPYLDELGISHLYVSSFLKARPGTMHGYDIIDHTSLNPEIGDEAALERLVAALRRHHMGMILDFVPNHMGVGGCDNAWWLDVLEWGQASPYAGHFDINWRPVRRELRGKVLLPFLGEHYGSALEGGHLVPRFDAAEGSVSVWYHGHRFPIFPGHYHRVLRPAVDELAGTPAGDALGEILALARTVTRARSGRATAAHRRATAQVVKARLAELARHPETLEAVERAVARLGGTPGEGRTFSALHKLLEAQSYRISYWRVAADEINYRRFFDINDLAGLRMERLPLFETAHRYVFDLLHDGRIHGLRIDHIDGLYHPAQYCQRLQHKAAEILGPEEDQPMYLLVEKILAHHERLRLDWPVAGTTGYEFMNLVNALFVDGEGEAPMALTYAHFLGHESDFEREVYEAKKLVMDTSMSSELHVLAGELGRIAQSHWRSRDFTLGGLRQALKEVVACFPVYRTYVTARRVTEQDRRYIGWAVAKARRVAEGIDDSIFDFLHDVVTTQLVRGRRPAYSRSAVVDFAMRLQQYTGPVMAKGYEDTALYRYNRLISLNEVGGEPLRFGVSPTAFHQVNRRRLRVRPHSMLATATHDAKRGEDVRIRISALSEMPDEWRQRLDRWSRLNQPFKRQIEGGEAPERNDEVLLYQTMLGAWPAGGDEAAVAAFRDRLADAMTKSLREAKRRTSWGRPHPAYEQAMTDFIGRIMESDRRNPFLEDFLRFQERLARLGAVYGLAQTLLKMTVPGVPDFYQGTELWQLALVDPDNRRPVDYALRRDLLSRLRQGRPGQVQDGWGDGGIKLFLIHRALGLRRERLQLFQRGDYRALALRGERANHVCAFARCLAEEAVVVAVPLLLARLWPEEAALPPPGVWRGVHVEAPRRFAGAPFRDVLTGRDIAQVARRGAQGFLAEELFAEFPVALLERR